MVVALIFILSVLNSCDAGGFIYTSNVTTVDFFQRSFSCGSNGCNMVVYGVSKEYIIFGSGITPTEIYSINKSGARKLLYSNMAEEMLDWFVETEEGSFLCFTRVKGQYTIYSRIKTQDGRNYTTSVIQDTTELDPYISRSKTTNNYLFKTYQELDYISSTFVKGSISLASTFNRIIVVSQNGNGLIYYLKIDTLYSKYILYSLSELYQQSVMINELLAVYKVYGNTLVDSYEFIFASTMSTVNDIFTIAWAEGGRTTNNPLTLYGSRGNDSGVLLKKYKNNPIHSLSMDKYLDCIVVVYQNMDNSPSTIDILKLSTLPSNSSLLNFTIPYNHLMLTAGKAINSVITNISSIYDMVFVVELASYEVVLIGINESYYNTQNTTDSLPYREIRFDGVPISYGLWTIKGRPVFVIATLWNLLYQLRIIDVRSWTMEIVYSENVGVSNINVQNSISSLNFYGTDLFFAVYTSNGGGIKYNCLGFSSIESAPNCTFNPVLTAFPPLPAPTAPPTTSRPRSSPYVPYTPIYSNYTYSTVVYDASLQVGDIVGICIGAVLFLSRE
eukprot:TRINITY_DN4912_c0_g1_i1.p1 TRINITY_DN4912_c0_g1~~TRINITY_DN4912_c0_g1_i1.p1  ORF type:complete len:558 (-),score=51.50 TRINITY_DN4912_c0_g1_i1:186-1859(-)